MTTRRKKIDSSSDFGNGVGRGIGSRRMVHKENIVRIPKSIQLFQWLAGFKPLI